VVTSLTPSVRDAHRDILTLVSDAAGRDPEAGHAAITDRDILAIIPDCDAMVTDVSSVGLDWLYLRTDKPIFLTDRHHDAERLRREIPVSRCADVIDHLEDLDEGQLTTLITARLEHDEHHLARVAMRHHYFDDLQVGDSTVRFLDAVSELVTLRDRLLGAEPAFPEESGAITA
jgi:CDP-glycerol glycerophosphotransferase (TagB/SpsB family)